MFYGIHVVSKRNGRESIIIYKEQYLAEGMASLLEDEANSNDIDDMASDMFESGACIPLNEMHIELIENDDILWGSEIIKIVDTRVFRTNLL